MCIQLTVAEKMSAYILRKHVCFLFVQFSLLLINLKKKNRNIIALSLPTVVACSYL